MKTSRSQRLFERAKRVIPGGVNSPVRAYGNVGGVPRFLERGKGCRVWDADGNAYIDYVGSWGPLILGHADGGVLRAVKHALADGTSFGAPTAAEVEWAELVCGALPGVEQVRQVSSGTEACMSALRLARAATGRSRLLKFEGCYHGHADPFLVGAGSGVATLGIPGSPGVPEGAVELTVQAPYNDSAAVAEAFSSFGEELACVFVEPMAGNMGFVPPAPGFLEDLRERCDRSGVLLVFDEVITGFRVGWGGAQGLLDVVPDLTCLGKVVGGGLPAAAYGGRRELMEQMAPVGPVYQAGTLAGNPLAVAAGRETLERLSRAGTYDRLAALSERLAIGLGERARRAGVELTTASCGGLFGFFFHPGPVRCFADAVKADASRFRRFFAAMLDEGILLPPSPFESCFASLAHGDDDVEETLEAASRAFRQVARDG